MKRVVLWGLPILALLLYLIPPLLDALAHRDYFEPVAVTGNVTGLHQQLTIVDLHADSMLWSRSLLADNSRGHVSLPQLQRGNFSLQAFTLVSEVPLLMNPVKTIALGDLINVLALAQRWPIRTWFNPLERLKYQADRLKAYAAESSELVIIRNRAELEQLLVEREKNQSLVGGFIGIEGAMALRHDLAGFDRLYQAGVRMVALTHFQDTVFAGSAHGAHKGGLTMFGRLLIERLKAKNIIIDVAHVSEPAILDILSLVDKPVLVSHTGVRGSCDSSRNISDRLVDALAANGAVIGVGFFPMALCGKSLDDLVRAMAYIKERVGVDHIALGSDYDGMVPALRRPAHLVHLTNALLESGGFNKTDIAKIMGENALRVLRANL